MERLAKTGDVRAEAWFALMLQNRGRWAEAESWWARAAEKGNFFAIGSLARKHEHDREYEEAMRWYRRGAELGSPSSQTAYATYLARGEHVPQDKKEAVRWYSAAAKQGSRYAFLPLAKLLLEQSGAPVDRVEILALTIAATRDQDSLDGKMVAEADTLARHLRTQMSADDVTRAELRSRTFGAP
jgi:TPR repeat protein